MSDAASDLPFRILNAYYEQTPLFLTRHHIDSYEHFVFNEMPRLIYGMNPITILKDPLAPEQGIYTYKVEIYIGGKVDKPEDLKIEVGAPIITVDGGKTVRRMFPNEARLRNLTYSAQIRMNIDIFITRTMKTAEGFKSIVTPLNFINYPLMKLPIMLRSKLCSLGQDSTEDSMIQKGESPLEHGGYFIIDGAEKLLISRQEQAFNSLYISRKAPTDLDTSAYATVVCQHPDTKINRRFSVYLGRDDNLIRVSIPSVRGMVPVFVLFRALGVETDYDIVRLIFPDNDSEYTKRYEDVLIPSIEDAWPITTQAMAISFISTLTHQGSIASVLDILRNHLFAHVPDMPLARAYYLADMVSKLIKADAKIISNTDRDDIRNQRLITSGTLIRDLFAAVWKDWVKSVSLTIDKTYNYNKTVYTGEKFQDIFAPGNINVIFNVEALNIGITKGFRGRWGTNPHNMKVGVLQPIGRISFYDAMSHCRRILLDFDTSMKQKGPRHLHPSQIGYFCTNETPTGAHIGVSKNYSMMTYVSLAAPVQPLLKWLETRGKMISIATADKVIKITGTRIKINGGVVGFSSNPQLLVKVLKLLKWTACLAPLTSVSFNTIEREISLYIDEGRPVRPLWHLSEGGIWPQMAIYINQHPDFTPSWRDLVLGSLVITKDRKISDVDFIDPLASRPEALLEDYIKELEPYAGAIEYVDPYESNEAFISWWGAKDLTNQHTHIEVHPSTMMGLMVSLIPFANHNQSPRNQLSCSQSKQGIGYYANNYLQRYDTYGSQLCYGEGPITRTLTFDHVGKGKVPYGFNCIVAMASTDGYNQDDGILFNKSSVERGMFRSLALRSYTALEEVDPISKVEYKIGHPKMVSAWTDLKPGFDYSKLDENGIIREGEFIEDHTILVGRYLENPETHNIKDSSIIPTVFTKGRVESVVVIHQNNGFRLVKIRIIQERIPELGDKFGSRHGQKGTMGMIIPAENMPHTAEGIIPDVIVNPHGLTSRMTVAQLIECLFGRMGVEIGAKCNGTSFFNRENIVKTVGESLMSIGLHPYTENIMYCGTTGKQLACSIFMGPLYFMRMKHLTSDKINSRGEGRREMRTHQPTGGRGNEGGMRIGEMERDAISAHGVSLFLQESMMKRSDATDFWICNGCGTIPIYNEKEKLFVCPLCDGPVEFSGTTSESLALIQPLKRSRVTFSKVEMPYALKLLEQEITTYTGSGLRFITEKSVGRLRDTILNWVQKPEAAATEAAATEAAATEAAATEAAATEAAVTEVPVTEAPVTEVPVTEAPVNNAAKADKTSEMAGGAVPFDDIVDVNLQTIGQETGQYSMDSYQNQKGGTAPVDHIDYSPLRHQPDGYTHMGQLPKINFIEPQTSGSVLKNEITQSDTDPVYRQEGGSAPILEAVSPIPVEDVIEEVWAQPKMWQGGADTVPIGHEIEGLQEQQEQKQQEQQQQQQLPLVNLQLRGGSLTNGAERPALIEETLGSNIDQQIFSMPAMGQEPFVIANPYVSPPMFPKEIASVVANPVSQIPVTPTQGPTVSTQLLGEVLGTVQQAGGKPLKSAMKSRSRSPSSGGSSIVFDSDEIKVIKLN
jgi:DNA-directed RNA polymerase II subunit RPB2